jgi:hypothetical protein
MFENRNNSYHMYWFWTSLDMFENFGINMFLESYQFTSVSLVNLKNLDNWVFWTFWELTWSFRSILSSDLGLNSFESCYIYQRVFKAHKLNMKNFLIIPPWPTVHCNFVLMQLQWLDLTKAFKIVSSSDESEPSWLEP